MNDKKWLASKAIEACRVLEILDHFTPEVVSTIFADLDIETSDIDIVCTHQDVAKFELAFKRGFSEMDKYEFNNRDEYAVGSFFFDGFVFEVYSSNLSTHLQNAYRHFQVMLRLVSCGGVKFSKQIRALKVSGLKTEPAICKLLSLQGDPYQAVLELESWSEMELSNRVRKFV